MTESTSLWALFGGSFAAATLLPMSSEAVLFGVLKLHSQLYWPALAVATFGNTLGGMSSYLIGRIIPGRMPAKDQADAGNEGKARALRWLQRYGSPAMLLAWLPVIGDPLCVAAGWLRLNWLWVMGFMAAGKFARYVVIAQGASM